MNTKESELTVALLNYVGRCLAENDLSALREVKLPYDIATRLNHLSMIDVHRYAQRVVPGHIAFDVELTQRTLDHMEHERDQAAVVRQLIAADASLELLESLGFAMTRAEYRERRTEVGVSSGIGRTPEPDAQTAVRVWEALRTVLGARRIDDANAHDYIEVYARTGVPLRQAWKVVQSWRRTKTV